jgi:hypothetical protein
MLNLCAIVVAILRIYSRDWKISICRHFQNGRHNSAQIQHCPLSTTFHIWVDKWQIFGKFGKRRISPLMVTYHYVKFYVSIIIHLEVININVRNFNFPIGFYMYKIWHSDRSPLEEQFCILKFFEMSAIFKVAAKTRYEKWAVKIQHCPIIYPHMKWRWNRTMMNLCGIVVAILKMVTGRNFSMSAINSGHHSTLFDFNDISYVGRLWCPEMIPDIEKFLPVAIFNK